jgi:hypothetical protein
MKGFIRKTIVLACAAAASAGCYGYRDLVDPCYPLRYSYMCREEVNAAFTPQVQNGQVLDQTVWNYFFELGTDRLNPLGMDRLAYIARRRPSPDCNLFLQTAQDVVYDPAAPEKMAEARHDLDARRVAAAQRFLISYMGTRPVDWHVVVIDPADPGLSAVPVNLTVLQMYGRFRGGLIGQGGNVAGGAGVQGAATGIGAGTGR